MKDRSTIVFILVLVLISGLMGYNFFKKPFLRQHLLQQQQQNLISTQEVVQKSDPIQYSAQEKISQLIAYPLTINQELVAAIPDAIEAEEMEMEKGLEGFDQEDNESATVSSDLNQKIVQAKAKWQALQSFNPGFVTFFGEQISQEQAFLTSKHIVTLTKYKKLKPLLAVDHEGGRVQRLSGAGFTQLDSWQELCSEPKNQLEASLSASAKELAEVGINVVFAPVIDISAQQPVMGDRVCADAIDTLAAAEIYVTEFAQYGIMPVLKHFPGMGNIQSDPHTTQPEIEIGPIDTNIFNDLVDKYVNIGVMTSHVRLKNRLDGLPCSLSKKCLNSFAQYSPEVTLFTDALDMAAADFIPEDEQATVSAGIPPVNTSDLALRAEQALRAGNYVLVFGEGITADDLKLVRSYLLNIYQTDEEFKQIVDERFARILDFKYTNQAAIGPVIND